MQKYINNVTDRFGNAMSGLSVRINLAGTQSLASIFSDNGSAPKANPFTTDTLGNFYFYAADGRYDILVGGTGYYDVIIADGAAQATDISGLVADVDDLNNDVTTLSGAVSTLDTTAAKKPELADASGSSMIGFTPAGGGGGKRTIEDKARERVSVADFYANGSSGALVDPTGAVDSTAGIQAAINSITGGVVYFPPGTYRITSALQVPHNSLTLKGAGAGVFGVTGGPVSTIRLYTAAASTVAIDATGYQCILEDIAVESNSGVSDGLSTIGFRHGKATNGSVGRLRHRNVRIRGFSLAQAKVHQAINYVFDRVDMSGGQHAVWIGRSRDGTQVSTSASIYDSYLTAGTEADLYLDRVADFAGQKIIFEAGGSASFPNSAAFYKDLGGVCSLRDCYFEANYRNINTNVALLIENSNEGAATNASIFSYDPGITNADRGSTFIQRNRLTTRWINADAFTGILELPDTTRNGVRYGTAKETNSTGPIVLGSSTELGGLQGGERIIRILSNLNSGGGFSAGDPGQSIEFGVSNSSAAATSRWFKIFHTRTDNSANSSLNFASNSGTTYYAPDGAQSIKLTIGSNNTITPGTDATIALGTASLRFTNLALSGSVGFYGVTPVAAKPTVTGSRGGNAAIASLLTALASHGLITDSTTA